MLMMTTYYSPITKSVYYSTQPSHPADVSIPEKPEVSTGQRAVFNAETMTWKVESINTNSDISISDVEYLKKEANENNNKLAKIMLQYLNL